MNPVTVADVVARFRALTTQESTRAQALLDDIWEEIIARVPGVVDRVTSGALRPGLVIRAVCEVIIPVLQNPEGYKEEHIDDWVGVRDVATATGRIFVPDDIVKLLTGTSPRTAFSITPAAQVVCAPWV